MKVFNNLLDAKTIEINGDKFELRFYPNIKIAGPMGVYIDSIPLETTSIDYLKNLFHKVKGKKKLREDDVKNIFDENKLDFTKLQELRDNTNRNDIYLSISIRFDILNIGKTLETLDASYEIGCQKPDPISKFLNEAIDSVQDLVKCI